MEYSGARGTLINEKRLYSKISCQTSFNLEIYGLTKTGTEGGSWTSKYTD